MASQKKLKIKKLLTEVELEIMNLIWDLGRCTVKDVQEALPSDRSLAYTSVATMMKILEQKNVLKSEKKDKAHSYVALLSREDYGLVSLKNLKENVFEGNPASMVMRLLNDSNLSRQEIESIQSLLQEKLRK